MQSVRLHVAGNGVIWALSKCKVCGEVDKHLAVDAVAGLIACKACGHRMDMKGATVEAVAVARDSRPEAADSDPMSLAAD
jgi:recombinational DNA repair protein (RecF pathway)